MIGTQVIDSSVIVKYVSHEPGWEEAGEYVLSGRTLGFALIETGNALWKKVLKDDVALEDLRPIVDSLRTMVLIEDEMPLLYDAIFLGIKLKLTVYDSMFIQLAMMRKETLVTADRVQAKAAVGAGLQVVELK